MGKKEEKRKLYQIYKPEIVNGYQVHSYSRVRTAALDVNPFSTVATCSASRVGRWYAHAPAYQYNHSNKHGLYLYEISSFIINKILIKSFNYEGEGGARLVGTG